jgi:hypothetical protein
VWLAGRVLLKIVYLLMRWLFGLAALAVRVTHGRHVGVSPAPSC